MRLKTITCSGANEHTAIEPLVKMLRPYHRAELGIQVSGTKASFSTARYWWLKILYITLLKEKNPVAVALHINSDWVERFCQGDVAPEIAEWLDLSYANGDPFICRVQLNFKIGREKTPDLDKMLEAIKRFPRQRFIFSYNDDNAEFIQKVHDTGLKFDLLFDSSHGEGILPESYPAPIFKDGSQGYSGGLSPENVEERLWLITKSVPIGRDFSIDAEGKLKGADKHFSIEKCAQYLKKASRWDAF